MTAKVAERVPRRGWRLILAVLILADLVSTFENMMVYAALKRFNLEFGDPTSVGWIISIYMLTSGAAAVCCGRLGDIFGSRRLMLILLGCACFGSVVSALHDNLAWVIVGRAIQGVAGAILPLCFTQVRQHIPEKRMSLAVGLLMSSSSLGAILGLVLGGLIVDNAPWQAMFWASAIMALIALVAAYVVLPRDSAGAGPSGSFDYAGLAFVPGVIALLLAISQLQAWGPSSPPIIGLFAGCLAIFTWWVWHELSLSSPLINLKLLWSRRIMLPNLCLLTLGLGPLQHTMILMLLLQQPKSTGIGLGMAAAVAGAAKVPANIASILLSPVIGQACRIFGSGFVAMVGFTLNLAAWLIALMWNESLAAILTILITSTLGSTGVYIAVSNAITIDSPKENVGEAMGVVVLGRSVMTALGAQMFTFVLASITIGDSVGSGARLPAPESYELAFMLLAAISGFGLLPAIAMFFANRTNATVGNAHGISPARREPSD